MSEEKDPAESDDKKEDPLRKQYARQKRLTGGLFLTMALLMLSMIFCKERLWLVTVFASCSVLTAIVFVYLQKCPNCKKRLPHDFNGTCPECGAELDDEPELK